MADEIRSAFRNAFRDFVTDGIPSSGKHKVKKSDGRNLGDVIQDALDGLPQGYQVSYETRAELYGDLDWPAGSIGRVFGDSNEAYRGVYLKNGAFGAGSWTRIGPLPGGDTSGLQAQIDDLEENKADRSDVADLDQRAPRGLGSVAGTNTITATATGLASYQIGQSFWLTPVATNSGAATLNIEGLGALPLKSADGADVEAGDLVAGTVYLLRVSGSGASQIRVIGTKSSIISDYLALREEQEGAEAATPGMSLVSDDVWPVVANSAGEVLAGYDRLQQGFVMPLTSDDANDAVDAADVGYQYSGGIVPLITDTKNGVVLGYDLNNRSLIGVGSSGGGTASSEEPWVAGYITDDGELRAVGGTGDDRLVNNDATLTWGAVQSVGGSLQTIVTTSAGEKLVRRVAVDTGNVFFDGQITIVYSYGQSNGEGQARSDGVANLFPVNPYPGKLRMPATPDMNVWLGQATTGGTSIELLPDQITGLTDLIGSIASTGTHGTTAIEGFAHALMGAAVSECYGYMPELIVWTGAEGGQSIANLMNDAPAGKYAFANTVTAVQRVMDFKPAGKRVVFGWIEMSQGEANSSDAALGSKHDLVRQQIEDAIQPITGQSQPVRMVSWQMSNFRSSSVGMRSILTHALSVVEDFGTFWCGGPTYPYDFSSDFTHHTSVGHRKRGELMKAVVMRVERGLQWVPLHVASASITGTNEITAILSENASIATTDAVQAIANAGIVVPGKTVTGVTITGGNQLKITTSEAAAGATIVEVGMNLQADEGDIANVPRTNIRSTASYGTYFDGETIRKWCCHAEVSIS